MSYEKFEELVDYSQEIFDDYNKLMKDYKELIERNRKLREEIRWCNKFYSKFYSDDEKIRLKKLEGE